MTGYDALLSSMFGAGQDLPACGFGLGDAVILDLLQTKDLLPNLDQVDAPDVVVFALGAGADGPDLRRAATRVTAELRGVGGVCVDLILSDKKPKWAFKHADRRHATLVVMLAPDEWARGEVVLKNLKTSEQDVVSVKELPYHVWRELAAAGGRLQDEGGFDALFPGIPGIDDDDDDAPSGLKFVVDDDDDDFGDRDGDGGRNSRGGDKVPPPR